MPERAPEIEELLRERARSTEDDPGSMLSTHPCLTSIGTDASEWMAGDQQQVAEAIREDTGPGGQIQGFDIDEVTAWREGSVAWTATRGWFVLADGRVPVRATGVLLEEDGEWKAVQGHISIGVPNDRMMEPMFQP